ncbi:MAG: TonB-dependent receptor [Bacteroidota bacterium]
MKLIIYVFLLLASVHHLCAQSVMDSIQQLDEVLLSDIKLKRYSVGYKSIVLNDSIMESNGRSLTDLLRFNSNIYLRENGYGMVSSPSFRGTNAAQTAVIWNGININSQLNGQVDFNTIISSNYDDLTIRSGGGSVQYGSGAIGGTVHLQNKIDFSERFEHFLRTGYGSFDTRQANYRVNFGNGKLSANAGIAYLSSENNFKYLGTDRRNENGAFNNLDVNFNLGYTLSQHDVLKAYHQNFRSDREFSGTLLAESNDKYETEDYRSMLEWAHIKPNWSSNLKAVHLFEQFRYFENKDRENFSEGQVNTWLIKHQYERKFNKRLEFLVITDFANMLGRGDSFGDAKRNAFSATAILSHRPAEKFQYALNIRQDVISDFESPLVFSGDFNYQVASWYQLKFNASRNFRVPTFNDLYWNPGGNLNLRPESSFQFDLGHEMTYKNLNLKLNTFYIETSDLIQWRPNPSAAFWSPINIASARHYGLEAELGFQQKIENHKIQYALNYSFTETEDLDKQQRLFYVPVHKANASIAYSIKKFSAFYQHLYNGEVEIIGGNLEGFDVANFGIAYDFNVLESWQITADFRINNLYNTYYENVAFRPMPNRNFTFRLTFNI